jgi:hypothetical protein
LKFIKAFPERSRILILGIVISWNAPIKALLEAFNFVKNEKLFPEMLLTEHELRSSYSNIGIVLFSIAKLF